MKDALLVNSLCEKRWELEKEMQLNNCKIFKDFSCNERKKNKENEEK